jgi:hypothetical protein
VVPAGASGAGTGGKEARGEEELPAQLAGGAGILAFEGVRQLDAGDAASEVAVVELAAPVELALEVGAGGAGKHDDAVLVALAAADDDLPAGQENVLDAEPATFEQAQAAAVQQAGHEAEEAISPRDEGEDGGDLLGGEDHREAFGSAGADGVEATEIDVEDLLVEEQQRVEGLVLGAGGDIAGDGEVSEELLDLGGAQVTGWRLW